MAAPTTPNLEHLSLEKLDVISPAHYEQNGYPHAEWAYLRKHAPVHRFVGETFDPFYAIVKHADIVEIGKNPTDFIIEPRLAVFTRDIPLDQTKLRHLLTMDPPEHRSYRAVTAKQFTPRMVQHWEPKVQHITREILDRASEKGTCDFVQDVAAPITIAVIAEMLGVPGDDWRLLFKWTNETIAPEDPEFQQGRTTEETLLSARAELFKYFSDLFQKRRAHPKDDMVSVVASGKVDGKLLEPFELLSYYLLLVVAGNETTRNAMTGGMLAFNDNPDEWRRLVANPGLLDSAVEEIVRWVTPVIQFTREATRDVVLRGTRIKKGESVCLFYASGN
ncbi:MAG TPA: cytochrome P450, partial [Myxococcota bacterium]|nr:cytochrome P450 [Myxococcota bacterium]